MGITSELRKWWVRKFPVMDKELHEDFTAIADRIDAEHQKAIRELNNLAEASVLLPVDADGERWHIGDRTESGQTVEAIGLNRYGWHFVGTINEIDPAIHRHHHAPTVEDVLRDVVTLCHNTWKEGSAFEFYDVDDVMKSGNIAEFAAKLRLAEGEDE